MLGLIVFIILIIFLFGGGFYGHRAGYAGYGYGGFGIGGLLLLILVLWLLFGGVGYYGRW
jgi:hypothetical protein